MTCRITTLACVLILALAAYGSAVVVSLGDGSSEVREVFLHKVAGEKVEKP